MNIKLNGVDLAIDSPVTYEDLVSEAGKSPGVSVSYELNQLGGNCRRGELKAGESLTLLDGMKVTVSDA